MQWMLKELTKVAPRSGGIRIEIKVKGHVIIDVHAIVVVLFQDHTTDSRGACIFFGSMGQIVKAAKITYAP